LLIAGAAGAITAICAFIKKIVDIAKNCVGFFTGLQKQIDTIEEHCRENYMRELQIIIMSEEMPLDERLKAGEEYVNGGGNGAIKAKYRILLQKYEEEHSEDAK
jgi:hypothetical protein